MAILSFAACEIDDQAYDPPQRPLVKCHGDAGADDPLACPPVDGGAADRASEDAGADLAATDLAVGDAHSDGGG